MRLFRQNVFFVYFPLGAIFGFTLTTLLLQGDKMDPNFYISRVKSDWQITATENVSNLARKEVFENKDIHSTSNFEVSDRSYEYKKESHGALNKQEKLSETTPPKLVKADKKNVVQEMSSSKPHNIEDIVMNSTKYYTETRKRNTTSTVNKTTSQELRNDKKNTNSTHIKLTKLKRPKEDSDISNNIDRVNKVKLKMPDKNDFLANGALSNEHEKQRLSSYSRPFQRQKGIVVVTKVHGPTDIEGLRQFLCLFTQAYNKDVKYDIVVFTTLKWGRADKEEMEKMAQPAKLTVAIDSLRTLGEKIERMRDEDVAHLLKRCNKTSTKDLDWWSICVEDSYDKPTPLKYAWMSTFRSFEIWKHPALKSYKYMVWLDVDALPTGPWKFDPVKFAVENKLVLFFDNFPSGYSNNLKFQQKMNAVYDTFICHIEIRNGKLSPIFPNKRGKCDEFGIEGIHGFFHITDLRFYRSKTNMNFLQGFVETFSREYDDQFAVLLPAAIKAPDLAWSMREHGFKMNIWHNGKLDGKENIYPRGYVRWFKDGRNNQAPGRDVWKEANYACDDVVTDPG